MRRLGKYFALLSVIIALAAMGSVGLGQTPTAVFTAEQAATGQASYQASCAGCHQNDLSGSGTAVPLAGAGFMGIWRAQSVDTLVGSIQATMPPANPGGLGDGAYVNIVAFILQANGAVAGNQPLMASLTNAIGTVATGETPVGLFAAAPAAQGEEVVGITVNGAVENYTPVTAENVG